MGSEAVIYKWSFTENAIFDPQFLPRPFPTILGPWPNQCAKILAFFVKYMAIFSCETSSTFPLQVVFRGLKFEPDAKMEQKGAF